MIMRELHTVPAAQVKIGDILIIRRNADEVTQVRRCEDSRFLAVTTDSGTHTYHERTLVRVAR